MPDESFAQERKDEREDGSIRDHGGECATRWKKNTEEGGGKEEEPEGGGKVRHKGREDGGVIKFVHWRKSEELNWGSPLGEWTETTSLGRVKRKRRKFEAKAKRYRQILSKDEKLRFRTKTGGDRFEKGCHQKKGHIFISWPIRAYPPHPPRKN